MVLYYFILAHTSLTLTVLDKYEKTLKNSKMPWDPYHVCLCVAGDLKDEEALLEWLIDNKDVGPASIIEEVDGKMLQNLVDTFEYLVVYFCEYRFACLWELLCFVLFSLFCVVI